MSCKGDLAEEILQVIADLDAEPWFPAMTGKLVAKVEQEQLHPFGLSLASYGTGRLLQRNVGAPRYIAASVEAAPGRKLAVEQLSMDIKKPYEALGLRFPADEKLNDAVFVTLQQAFQLISTIPSLDNSISVLVHAIHILDAGDNAYDVRHSDPVLPFSVFLSIPSRGTPNAALRVMESIVHEAMHLQLTVIEWHIPLVSHSRPSLRSPWRRDLRSPRGVLHGIYVFCVILSVYRLAKTRLTSPDELHYVRRRIDQIDAELCSAYAAIGHSDVTPVGQQLLDSLRRTDYRH